VDNVIFVTTLYHIIFCCLSYILVIETKMSVELMIVFETLLNLPLRTLMSCNEQGLDH
jgi:hypothetical protein